MADVKLRMRLKNGEYIEIDKNNGLKLIESLSQSTGQPKDLVYGIIANNGNASIIDVKGEFIDLIESGQITNSNVPIWVIANGNIIQSHITTDSEYDSNSKNFSTKMTNNISNLSEKTYKGFALTETSRSVYEILYDVITSLGYSDNEFNEMLKRKLIYGKNNNYGSISDYLKVLHIPYSYLSSGNYRETINKVCDLCQLQLYEDNLGFPVFTTARPVVSDEDIQNAIIIRKKNISGNFEKSVILKNKYDSINMNEKVVDKTMVDNSICGEFYSDETTYTSESSIATITKSKSDGYNYEMKLKLYFRPFTAKIPAKTNLNLNTTYNVTNLSSVSNVGNDLLIEDIKTYNYYIPTLKETISISPEILKQELGSNADSFLQEKINNVTYNTSDDTFTIDFVACVGRDCSTTVRYGAGNSELLESQEYRATSISFKFLGEQLTVNFNDKDISVSKSTVSNTIATVSSNELLQSNIILDGVKISKQIQDNIFNDYRNGISNGKVTLFCSDMYSAHQLVKNWSNGEILDVGDVILFEGDTYSNNKQRYWRITGREFVKSGVPKLTIEVQEVKKPLSDSGLYSDSAYKTKIMTWEEMVENGTITLSEDEKILTKSNTSISGYLKLDDNITTLSSRAFRNCNGLLGIDLGKVEKIGGDVFENCTGLTEIEIPDTVKYMDAGTFIECSNLKSVKLGKGITKLEQTFIGCTSLSSIDIPSNITMILNSSFWRCSNLSQVNLSEGLIEIGEYAFDSSGITSISLPSTLYKIGQEAFINCSALAQASFIRTTGWRASDKIDDYYPNVTNPITNAKYLTQTYLGEWYNDEL